jgi:hypothetical protein
MPSDLQDVGAAAPAWPSIASASAEILRRRSSHVAPPQNLFVLWPARHATADRRDGPGGSRYALSRRRHVR